MSESTVTRNRPTRRLLVGVIAGCVLVAATTAGWIVESRRSAKAVQVAWELKCSDETILRSDPESVIESRPGWACDVVVTVTNRSSWKIAISRVDAPTMGQMGAGEIEGKSVPAARLGEKFLGHDDPTGDSIDAWSWHRDVPAKSAESITLPIGWREKGCNSAGGFSFPDWPTVHFRSLGLRQEASSDQTLAFKTFDDAHDRAACADLMGR